MLRKIRMSAFKRKLPRSTKRIFEIASTHACAHTRGKFISFFLESIAGGLRSCCPLGPSTHVKPEADSMKCRIGVGDRLSVLVSSDVAAK